MTISCFIPVMELIVIVALSVVAVIEAIMLLVARRKNRMLRQRLLFAEGGFEPVNPFPGHWSSREEPDLEF